MDSRNHRSPGKTTSAVAILALFDILRDHGVTAEQVRRKTGISRKKMADPDARISMGQFLDLWQIAVDVTGDQALGLNLRLNYGTGYTHFVIMIAMNCHTLIEAVRAWADYAMLICDTDRVDLFEREDHFFFTYACSDQVYENRWIPEHHFSIAIDYGRRISGRDYTPAEVWFKHEDPGYPGEYEKIFRCPVFFGKDENMMKMKKSDMLLPVISPDPYLKALLKKHADKLIGAYTEAESLAAGIRLWITGNLSTGSVSARSASDAMNMDRSTLHRHLKKEGTTFRTLLTQTRKELAKKHLAKGLTASQTAYLLGFSEPSTFQHAFKRWFGRSPGEFRKTFSRE